MISVTVLTKNSAAVLAATLHALHRFSEVLVCDTGSTDATEEIAKSFPNVRFVKIPFQGFGPTHNLASKLATHDWILSIDSDEIVSPELADEILTLRLDPNCVYALDRHNYFHGKRIRCCAGWYPDPVYRLYHRGATLFSDDHVHEKVRTEGLFTALLRGPLLHTPYPGVEHLLEKMGRYGALFAQQHAGKRRSSPLLSISHAAAAFFKNYFLKRGFLGGKEGWILSLHNTLTTYYKYLLLWQANERLGQAKEPPCKELQDLRREESSAALCKERKANDFAESPPLQPPGVDR